MKAYATQSIRNVGIAGHGDTGKTQLVSSLLFTAGMTTRLGKVAEGNTVTDWDEEEIARKITIHTAQAYAEWAPTGQTEKVKINFLDTPGYSTFLNDTRASLVAADAALILVDAACGSAGGHREGLGLCHRVRLAARVRDQLDGPRAGELRPRDGVDHARVRPQRGAAAVADRRGERFPRRGRSDHDESAPVYARRRRQAHESRTFPRFWPSAAKIAHESLVEMVAEGDDALMEEFFEKGTLPIEDLMKGLARRVPGKADLSGRADLRAAQYRQRHAARSAGGCVSRPGKARRRRRPYAKPAAKGNELHRKTSDAEPVSIFVYKTLADPFSGPHQLFQSHVRRGEERCDAAEFHAQHQRTPATHPGDARQDGDGRGRVARRGSGRHRQAEGHPHRRYAGRQGGADPLSAAASSRTFDHLRRGTQDARGRRPHRPGNPPDS